MTVEVGDTFPFAGVKINLDAVALALDSRLQRRNLEDPKGPSSIEAEWAPDAVRAGNFIPERMWRCHNVLNCNVIVGTIQATLVQPTGDQVQSRPSSSSPRRDAGAD